jgi:hypothetical protein
MTGHIRVKVMQSICGCIKDSDNLEKEESSFSVIDNIQDLYLTMISSFIGNM